jgi:hypothetical protein
MQKPGAIRKEHAKACEELKKLEQKGRKAGSAGPLESDVPLKHDKALRCSCCC